MDRPMRRKLLIYIVFALPLGFVGWMKLRAAPRFLGSFSPPSAAERKEAVGSTRSLTPDLRNAFDSSQDSFAPIPAPGRSDWLSNFSESGQTFVQYRRSLPNRPDQQRTTIYLQPLGSFPVDVAPSLNKLADYASAFFDMPVNQLPEIPIQGLPVKTRSGQIGPQILTGDVLQWMKPRIPKDAYCLLAVTMTDLYPDPKWNFVFGQGSLKDRVGVYSFARYLPSGDGTAVSTSEDNLMLLRSCKVLAHETGHLFGMKHCVHYHCLMNGSNGLSETDSAPIHLCPVCLRKLHFAKPFEVAPRYQKLQVLSQRFGWNSEAAWLTDRVKSLND